MSQSNDWVTVKVNPGAESEAVLAALFEAGAQGVQEIAGLYITHVESEQVARELCAAALAANPDAQVETAPLPTVDWTEKWKDQLHVQSLGDLKVAPPWLADSLDAATTIVIEPGMAFGTGEHATTRGVVRLMQGVMKPGARVADLGAGSAVLAIAAAKLGAGTVAAIELDPDAIGNAEENVQRNGVADIVRVIEGDASMLLPLVAPIDIVLANIISSVLIDILPTFALALADGGFAILSGMLFVEREDMVRAFKDAGWRLVAEDHEDAWWSATIVRR
ncbi:MAG TPA: 50S ribosomal protein L11 methyltransferase [Gemmatimonadaceae bacterium]